MIPINNDKFPFTLYISEEDAIRYCEKRGEQGLGESTPQKLLRLSGLDYNHIIKMMKIPDLIDEELD